MEFIEQQARALYRVLNHGQDFTDCRCIDVNRPGSPPVSREVLKGEDNFIKWCRSWHGKANCYVGRNPRKADGTVSRITSYSLDIDPEHAPRTSVSRDQLARAVLAGRRILQTWPGGYLAESGNGALVLYRLSVPVTEELETFSRWLADWQNVVRRLLVDKFPGEVRCDSIHDNERIIKIPGTLSTKGDPINHRLARWLTFPNPPFLNVSGPHAVQPPAPRTVRPNGGPVTIERLDQKIQIATACLARLSKDRCENYDAWIKVGLALSELGPIGLHLWDTWSKKSQKYQPGTCEAKWGTFDKDPSISVGSISFWANQDDPNGARSNLQSADGQCEPESFNAFMEKVDPPAWVCKNLVAKGSIGFVAGLPKTMKTWLLMDFAIECARGGKWLNLFPVEKVKVLYVDQERAKGETQRRFRGMLGQKGLTPADLNEYLIVECGTTTRINLEPSFQAFRNKLVKLRPTIVVIDSFVTFHTCEENNRQDIQVVFENLKKLRNEFGCTFIFIDHETKNVFTDRDIKEDPSAFRMMGSVGKAAAAEFVLTVRRFDQASSGVYHTLSTLGPLVPSFTVSVHDTPDGHINVAGSL